MRLCMLLGVLATLTVAALAVNLTLTGPSGLITLPTAEVMTAGQLGIALDYYNTDQDATIPLRVTYGITQNWEAGARYAFNDAANIWAVNTKYLTPLSLADFRVAAGAQYSQNDAATITTVTQVYLAGTRILLEAHGNLPAVSGTVGVNWTQIDPGADAFRAALGLQTTCKANITTIAEYQTKSNRLGEGDPVWALGVRYPVTPQVTVQAGVTNGALLAQAGSNFVIGVSFACDTTAP